MADKSNRLLLADFKLNDNEIGKPYEGELCENEQFIIHNIQIAMFACYSLIIQRFFIL